MMWGEGSTACWHGALPSHSALPSSTHSSPGFLPTFTHSSPGFLHFIPALASCTSFQPWLPAPAHSDSRCTFTPPPSPAHSPDTPLTPPPRPHTHPSPPPQALQRGLPRPVSLDRLPGPASRQQPQAQASEASERLSLKERAEEMLAAELALLLRHDAAKYPLAPPAKDKDKKKDKVGGKDTYKDRSL